jgi:flagellar biosynthesis GTPase FlhF
MELQRILAADTRSATDRATALFGHDVLVISNHRVNGQTELVIAVDLDEKALLARTELTAPSNQTFSSHLSSIQGQLNAAETKFSAKQSLRSEDEEQEYLRSREIIDLIRKEFADLRRELALSQYAKGWHSDSTPSDELNPLFTSLSESGMSLGLRTHLLDSMKDLTNEQDALLAIKEQLCLSLSRPLAPIPEAGVHLIAGPSGAGKTLMAARLASNASIKLGPRQVAIISYRDLRFGAWSQTQLLAAQIGVDCFRADDPATLELLLNELSPRGLVIIDTPGFQMNERISEVKTLCPDCVCHAIMPADASAASLKKLTSSDEVNWQSLMISKVDESVHAWPLLEFMCHNSLRISVGSDGDHLSNLKRDLTTDLLVNKAVSNFAHLPPKQITARIPMRPEESLPLKVFAAGAPRGLRGPFN